MPNTGMGYNEALDWAVETIRRMLSVRTLYLSGSEAHKIAKAMTTLTGKRWVVKPHHGAPNFYRVVETDLFVTDETNKQSSGSI